MDIYHRRRYLLSILIRFTVYFLISVAGVLVVLTSLEYGKFDLERARSQDQESLRLSLASKGISTQLSDSLGDIRTIAALQSLKDYIHQVSDENQARLEQEFLNFARHTRAYDQIRYIDSSGRERVRVNFDGRVATVVPQDQLQDKSGRYYFQETAALQENAIFISPLDLNIEQGRIERPFKPIVRFATPVFDAGRRQGIIILNYLAAVLLKDFKDYTVNSWGEPVMVNPQGYWLSGTKPEEEWGFMLGNDETFGKRFPEAWLTINRWESGAVRTAKGLFIFKTVRPYVGSDAAVETHTAERYWKLITRISPVAVTYSPLSILETRPAVPTGLLLLAAILSMTLAWLRTNHVANVDALRDSEHRLAEAQRIAHVGHWVWNILTGKLSWSDETYRIFGRQPQEFASSYESFLAVIHPDDREMVINAVNNAVHHNAPYAIDHRVILPDGTVRQVHERGAVERNMAGEPVWMHGTVQDTTERTQIEHALRQSEERFRELIQQAPDGIFIADLQGRYTDVNRAGCNLLGFSRQEIIGKTIADFLPLLDVKRLWQVKKQLMRGGIHLAEWTLRRKDGAYLPVEVSSKILPDGRWQGFVRDISKRKQLEEQLRQAATVFDNTMEAIMITDPQGRIQAVNDAYTNLTGYAAEEVLGKDPKLHQSGRHDQAFYQALWQSLNRSGQWQGEIWNRRKNGDEFPAWENISVVKDDEGRITNFVSVMSDISPIKQAEAQLNYLAHHDALTGLSNRLAFVANLEKALERAKRYKQLVALLLLDLDRFKLINDTMGHAAGDRMLQAISERLKKCVRAEDTVARLGGDEFTVILSEIAQVEDAALLAGKIINAIEAPIFIEDRQVVTSTSVGISIYPNDAGNVEDLVKAADAAMYRAKDRGRHTYEFYTKELTILALEHLAMENALRQALAGNEFELHYQPVLNLTRRNIVAVEALLRWRHPQKGLISPEEFIAVAEETGLIVPIGDWVLREACRQAAAWRAEGLPPLRVAINLSGRQVLHDSLANKVRDELQQCGVRPGELRLDFEVTERMLYSTERSIEALRQLKSLKVKIAIDDFGIGYSSLSQLKRLPVDTLKIDRAFMQAVPDDPGDRAIAAAIISLGHAMDLKVIAEGVETVAQQKFLESQGCDEVQGFLFSKPVTADEIRRLVQDGEAQRVGTPQAF